MPFCVGVTGGIGSGKSRAAALFGELGADVVDTDNISHELTAAGGSAMPAITASCPGTAERVVRLPHSELMPARLDVTLLHVPPVGNTCDGPAA